jgi:hypothetical protein
MIKPGTEAIMPLVMLLTAHHDHRNLSGAGALETAIPAVRKLTSDDLDADVREATGGQEQA